MMIRSVVLFVMSLICLGITESQAEITVRDAQRYCVDIVLLRGGKELRGSILKRDKQTLRMAIQRDWLTENHADLAQEAIATEAKQRTDNRRILQDRITKWRDSRRDQPRLKFNLERELTLLEKPLGPNAEESQFAIVEVPADRVRRVFEAAPASKSLAAMAWSDNLPKVESTTFGKLKVQVEATHPHWAKESIDISDRLPRGQTESADEWAARQAIWEYDFVEAVNFQGMGNFVIRIEADKRPDLAALLNQSAESLLAGQLGGLGLDLGGNTKPSPSSDWQQVAISEAEKIGTRGFLVTRSLQVTGQGPAVVSAQFFAKLNDDKFHVIWSDEVRTDQATIKDEDVQRIQQDPQLQEALKIAQGLNLGNEVQKAVRFGGAVEASLKSATNHFGVFRSRYTRTLDGPPLALPSLND